MERVFSRVVVVEDDFDDLVGGEDEGICVCAVDERVCGGFVGGEDGVEGGDEGWDVGYVIEKGTGLRQYMRGARSG